MSAALVLGTKQYGDEPFFVPDDIGGYTSSDPTVATVDSNGRVTILKAGTTLLESAVRRGQLIVSMATPVLTGLAPILGVNNSRPFQLTISSTNRHSPLTYTTSVGNIVDIEPTGSIRTLRDSGTCTLTIAQASDDCYMAISESVTLVVVVPRPSRRIALVPYQTTAIPLPSTGFFVATTDDAFVAAVVDGELVAGDRPGTTVLWVTATKSGSMTRYEVDVTEPSPFVLFERPLYFSELGQSGGVATLDNHGRVMQRGPRHVVRQLIRFGGGPWLLRYSHGLEFQCVRASVAGESLHYECRVYLDSTESVQSQLVYEGTQVEVTHSQSPFYTDTLFGDTFFVFSLDVLFEDVHSTFDVAALAICPL